MRRTVTIAFVAALILACEGRGVGVRAATEQPITHVEPGALSEPVRRLRAVDGRGNISGYYRAAHAFHDSLAAAGDTAGFDYACALDALVRASNVHDRRTDPRAREYAARAVATKRTTVGAWHPETAFSLVQQAEVEGWGNDRFGRADSLLAEAEAIQTAWHGRGHREVARVLRHRAEFQREMGDLAGARRTIDETIEILQADAQPDTMLLLVVLSVEADVVAAAGEPDRAVQLRRDALELQRRLGAMRPQQVMVPLHLLGVALLEAGRPIEARQYLVESTAHFDSRYGADHLDVRSMRGALGVAQFLAGDDRAARASLEAATTSGQFPNPDNTALLGPLTWLGVLELVSGDPVRARSTLEHAVRISRERQGENHPRLAHVLEPLIYDLQALGKSDSALVVLRDAQRNRASQADAGSILLDAQLDLAEAFLHLELRDTTAALAALERARARTVPDATLLHSMRATASLTIARIQAARGMHAEAIQTALEVERSRRTSLGHSNWRLPERQALQLAAIREGGIDLALDVLIRAPDLQTELRSACLEEIIRSRGMVLDMLAARRHELFANLAGSDIEARTRPRRRLLAQASRDFENGRGTRAAGASLTLQEALEVAESASMDPRRNAAAATAATSAIGLDAIRASLPRNSALVAFWRREIAAATPRHWSRPAPAGASRYVAIVLRADEAAPTIVDLGDATRIDGFVRAWLRDCSPGDDASRDRSCVTAGRWLRANLLDPIHSWIADQSTIFVVPDGPIGALNLAALPDGSGRCLLETGPALEVVPCERDLVGRPAASRGQLRKTLVVGGVDYFALPAPEQGMEPEQYSLAGADSPGVRAVLYRGSIASCGAMELGEFQLLPGATAEVVDVQSAHARSAGLSSMTMLTGVRADEASVKGLAPRAGALHLATHGFFLDPRCEDSGRRLAGWETAEARILLDNPLTRCGLALAGANRRAEAGPDEEDGLLTGDEIAALDLSSVEFVVLSACNSGVGEVLDGEGVLGLQRAFKIAGAGPVVMSLWPVEDQATRQWMRHFYAARLTPGVTTAEATRRASLAMLAERRRLGLSTRPSTWGAFVSVGVEREGAR